MQPNSHCFLNGGRGAAVVVGLLGLIALPVPGFPVVWAAPALASVLCLLAAAMLLVLPGLPSRYLAVRWLAGALMAGAGVMLTGSLLGLDAAGWAADYFYRTLDATAFLALGLLGWNWRRRNIAIQWLALWVACVAVLHLMGYAAGHQFRVLDMEVALREGGLAMALVFAVASVAVGGLGWSVGGWREIYQGRDDRRVMAVVSMTMLLGFSVLMVVELGASLHAVLGNVRGGSEAVAVMGRNLQMRAVPLGLGGLLLCALLLVVIRTFVRPMLRIGMQGREYLETLLEQSPSALIVIDPEGRVHEFNREAQQLLRRPASNVIGHSVELLFPMDFVASHLRGRTPGRREPVCLEIVRGDGTRHPVQVRMVCLQLWEQPVCILQLSDHGPEAARAAMQLRWQEAFMNAAWGIALSDSASEVFLDVNPAYALMHGYEREELIGFPIHALYLAEHQSELGNHITKARGGGVYRFESIHRRKDGSTFPVRIELSCKRDIERGVELFIGNVQDISVETELTERLRESEQVSRLVLNVQTEMVVRWRPDTGILFANRSFAEVFGQDMEALAGLRWLHLARESGAKPGDVARFKAIVDDLARHPRRMELVIQLNHASKGCIWVQWTVLPLYGPNQTLEGFQATGVEVTARRQAEDALAQSERWFRGVFDTMFHHMAIVDANGCLRALNQNAASFLGRPAPVLLGSLVWELDVFAPFPATVERLRQAIHTAANGRSETRLELQLPNVLGVTHVFDLAVRPMVGEGAGPDHIVLEALDISALKEQERKVHEREEHFSSVTASMPGMAFQFVREAERLRILYLNRGGAQMCQSLAGSGPLEVEHSMLECIHPEFRIDFFQKFKAGERSAKPLHWVGRVNHLWDEVWVSLHAEPHLRPEGLVWSGVAIDITALKVHEHALENSQNALRELAVRHEIVREDERRHLAREVHDELGQNLTALRMGLSVLGQRAELSDLHSEVARLKGVVDSSIGTVRSIVTSLRPPAMDLGIAEALRWVTSEFQAHTRIECDLSLEVNEVTLQDETATALFRIIQESLTNVAKHAQANRVNVMLRRMGRYLVVEVVDDGRGFDVHDRKGGGFGLLGMKERIISLSGTLVINSAPGQGTVVSIQIPAIPKETAA